MIKAIVNHPNCSEGMKKEAVIHVADLLRFIEATKKQSFIAEADFDDWEVHFSEMHEANTKVLQGLEGDVNAVLKNAEPCPKNPPTSPKTEVLESNNNNNEPLKEEREEVNSTNIDLETLRLEERFEFIKKLNTIKLEERLAFVSQTKTKKEVEKGRQPIDLNSNDIYAVSSFEDLDKAINVEKKKQEERERRSSWFKKWELKEYGEWDCEEKERRKKEWQEEEEREREWEQKNQIYMDEMEQAEWVRERQSRTNKKKEEEKRRHTKQMEAWRKNCKKAEREWEHHKEKKRKWEQCINEKKERKREEESSSVLNFLGFGKKQAK